MVWLGKADWRERPLRIGAIGICGWCKWGFLYWQYQEFYHPRDWGGTTVGEFMDELDAWMEWYRSGRISQRLGWLTPDEYRLSLGYPV